MTSLAWELLIADKNLENLKLGIHEIVCCLINGQEHNNWIVAELQDFKLLKLILIFIEY